MFSRKQTPLGFNIHVTVASQKYSVLGCKWMGNSCVYKALANKLLNWWRDIILGCRRSFF